MKASRRVLAIGCCVISLHCPGVFASPQAVRDDGPYRLEHWRTEAGLPHGSIGALLQDHRGFLWIGTLRGLVRFDGVRFEPAHTAGSRPLRDITCLTETPDGGIWVGTGRSGLIHLRPDSAETRDRTTGFPDGDVRCLAVGSDGTVWAGTGSAGIISLQPPYSRTGSITIADGLPTNTVVDIAVADNGTVWAVLAEGSVASVANGKVSVVALPGARNASLAYAVSSWEKGKMLLGTSLGLLCWQSGSWTTLFPPPPSPGNYYNVIRPGRNGGVWIGTYASGLLRWDTGTASALRLTRGDGLAGNYVGCLLEDREGNLWIGTEDGLDFLRSVSVRMISEKEGFDNEGPMSLVEDRAGDTWVGTDGGGLYRIRDHRVIEHLNTPGSMSGNELQTLAFDTDGTLLVGTERAGILTVFGKTTGRLHPGRSPENVTSLLTAADGSLWVGGSGRVDHWRGDQRRTFDTGTGIPDADVHVFLEDREGAIWAGTTAGLCVIRDTVVSRISRREGLPDDLVRALCQDTTGAIWAGTASGLVRFTSGRVDLFGAREGLLEESVSCILEDGLGYLWYASPTGIVRIPRIDFDRVAHGEQRLLRVMTLGVQDGMATAECADIGFPAGLRRRNGELWFPTPRGLAVVDPGRLHLGTPVVSVHIDQVTSSLGGRHAGETITLAPSDNAFTITYTTPTFSARDRTRFRYRLAGFDPGWIDAGDRRIAYYTNVPPGEYRFEVEARAGVPGNAPDTASIALFVSPHFYQTVPFSVGAGILLLLSLAGSLAYGVRRSKKREEDLARKVDQRTGELREEVAERRRAESALRESEERQNAVMLLMPVVMYTATTPSEMDAEWISANVERITGFPASRFTGEPRFWVSRIHPEDVHLLQHMMEQVRTGIAAMCEYRWLCADGQYRWFLDSVVSARERGNGLFEYSGILLENHERRLAEDRLRTSLREKEVLLKEIHHRVKNNLTVISSLLNLQAGGSSDRRVVDVLRDASHRVASMATIHEQLYRSDNLASIDFRDYAKRLTRQLLRTYAAPGVTLELEVRDVFLEINEAIPCGLIINELVTNALKYAFPGRATGRIVVSFQVAGDGLHTLTVRDDGIGIDEGTDPERVSTLGLRLVSLLAEQIGGKAKITRDHGTTCSVEFRPAPRSNGLTRGSTSPSPESQS